MAMINPERIVFESEKDLVDFVARGMVPRRKDFDKFIVKVRNPDDEHGEGDITKVRIGKNVFLKDYDNEVIDRVLTRVYEDRVHNRNMMLTVAGIAAGIVGVLMFGSGNKDDTQSESRDSQM